MIDPFFFPFWTPFHKKGDGPLPLTRIFATILKLTVRVENKRWSTSPFSLNDWPLMFPFLNPLQQTSKPQAPIKRWNPHLTRISATILKLTTARTENKWWLTTPFSHQTPFYTLLNPQAPIKRRWTPQPEFSATPVKRWWDSQGVQFRRDWWHIECIK